MKKRRIEPWYDTKRSLRNPATTGYKDRFLVPKAAAEGNTLILLLKYGTTKS